MDRMLASDDQIRLTRQGRNLLPLFADQQSSGMTPEEWASTKRLVSSRPRMLSRNCRVARCDVR